MCLKKVISNLMEDESGFVLILTMVMLAVLTMLGVMVLNTTDTELSITSNERMNVEAFNAAETALQYAQREILDERMNAKFSASEFEPIVPDAEFDSNSTNEIFAYSDIVPSRIAAKFSVDATSKGNIFSTAGAGSSANMMPYYRATISVKRQRSEARLEVVQVDMTSI